MKHIKGLHKCEKIWCLKVWKGLKLLNVWKFAKVKVLEGIRNKLSYLINTGTQLSYWKFVTKQDNREIVTKLWLENDMLLWN